ncbi:MAG TPA: winged helix-turn-helix domain-containing protein [Polyangiales bacterium]|nr:winged helix-turn-helix domain-containing protein [Polyangiales bacterium]
MRALGRRTEHSRPRLLKSGELQLDVASHTARRSGEAVALTAREVTILEALAASPRRCVSRTRLLSIGSDKESAASAASLEVLVGRIRRTLGDDVIRTQRGEGYALEVE